MQKLISIILLLLLAGLFNSCNNNDENDALLCDSEVIISAEQYVVHQPTTW